MTAPRPTWEEVINPLADSTLWTYMRRAASAILERRLAGTGMGISSSDINHTVFGVAEYIYRAEGASEAYPGKVMIQLVHEAYGD